MRFRLFVSLLVLVVLPMAAHAQLTGTPGLQFKGGETAAPEAAPIVPPDITVYDSVKNSWLSSTLRLNQQNQLLSRLVERQSGIAKVKESYDKIGLPYDAPPPPRSVCEQLPLNSACARGYPDMYGGYVAERKKIVEQEVKDLLAQAAATRKANAAKKGQAADGEVLPTLVWQDIRCMNGQCVAVLMDTNRAGFMQTVQVGDKVGKSTKITRINRDGVTIVQQGKSIDLNPAPLQTASNGATGAAMPSDIQGLMGENMATVAPAPAPTVGAPQVAAPADDAAAAPTEDPNPAPQADASGESSTETPVGNTGMF